MPLLTAQSTIALAASKMRRMVGLSPTWQEAIAGLLLPDEAPANVWLRNVIGTVPRPFGVVGPGQLSSYELVAGGDQNYFRESGGVQLYLACDTPPEFREDDLQAEHFAANFFGLVMADVMSLAAADDPDSEDGTSHLMLTGSQHRIFDRVDERKRQSLGDFYFSVWDIPWGDGEGGRG